MAAASPGALTAGLLGDTASRDYSAKLHTFNAFAEPELRSCMARLRLQPGMNVLDAGCGTGEALSWLAEQVGPRGAVTGIDLSAAHVASARLYLASSPHRTRISLLQGDLLSQHFEPHSFDLIWCVNTLNHLHQRESALMHLRHLLRPGGRIALGQSCLLPDMLFAWDARLEQLTNTAVRRYYERRYKLTERDLTSVRSLLGLLRQGEFSDVAAHSVLIERTSPLDPASLRHIAQTLLRETCGPQLRPWLEQADYEQLARYADPDGPSFALTRPDFHFLQTFTVVTGRV